MEKNRRKLLVAIAGLIATLGLAGCPESNPGDPDLSVRPDCGIVCSPRDMSSKD